MTEFENYLRFASREAVFVGNPAAQNEGVVVETKVFCIDEKYFAKLDRLRDETVLAELDTVILGRFPQDLAEFKEALA